MERGSDGNSRPRIQIQIVEHAVLALCSHFLLAVGSGAEEVTSSFG